MRGVGARAGHAGEAKLRRPSRRQFEVLGRLADDPPRVDDLQRDGAPQDRGVLVGGDLARQGDDDRDFRFKGLDDSDRLNGERDAVSARLGGGEEISRCHEKP